MAINNDTYEPEYKIYSSHDFHVANVLLLIQPTHNFTYVPYASQISIEMYKNGSSFYIKTLFNHEPVPIDECGNKSLCEFDQFASMLEKNFILDREENLKKCYSKPGVQPFFKQVKPQSGLGGSL